MLNRAQASLGQFNDPQFSRKSTPTRYLQKEMAHDYVLLSDAWTRAIFEVSLPTETKWFPVRWSNPSFYL